jgi:hypothetical protein
MRIIICLLREKGLELLLGGLIGFIFGIVPAIVGNSPNTLMVIVLVLVSLLMIYFWVRDQRRNREKLRLGKMIAFQKPQEGVIFTLRLRSAERGSIIYLVYEALKPKFIGFLVTSQTQRVVEEIVRRLILEERTYKTESWEITGIDEGKTKTSLVIDLMGKQGLQGKDIVLDITGGTATMLVAATSSQDTKCHKNVYIEESQKLILIINYMDFTIAQGNRQS